VLVAATAVLHQSVGMGNEGVMGNANLHSSDIFGL
jgi:hypothetical protein